MSERDRLLAAGAPPAYDGGQGSLPPPPPYYNNPQPPPTSVQPILVQPAVCHTVVIQRRPIVSLQVPPPPDYMCLAIIAALFCFPLGLLAMAKSSKVRDSLRAGDMCAAYRNAHQSRLLSRLAITLGVLIVTAVVLPSVLVPLIATNNPN